jgi:hypothetical protein
VAVSPVAQIGPVQQPLQESGVHWQSPAMHCCPAAQGGPAPHDCISGSEVISSTVALISNGPASTPFPFESNALKSARRRSGAFAPTKSAPARSAPPLPSMGTALRKNSFAPCTSPSPSPSPFSTARAGLRLRPRGLGSGSGSLDWARLLNGATRRFLPILCQSRYVPIRNSYRYSPIAPRIRMGQMNCLPRAHVNWPSREIGLGRARPAC